MTTVTVEIDKDKDLSALKELMSRLGLKYYIDETSSISYTDEVKNMLDSRYADFRNGTKMVSADESRERIKDLLAAKK